MSFDLSGKSFDTSQHVNSWKSPVNQFVHIRRVYYRKKHRDCLTTIQWWTWFGFFDNSDFDFSNLLQYLGLLVEHWRYFTLLCIIFGNWFFSFLNKIKKLLFKLNNFLYQNAFISDEKAIQNSTFDCDSSNVPCLYWSRVAQR